ncbi:hypothetical protein EVAR_81395_1 [Eumeta japonica]|uniref:Uncharacterized protein n=1 Tax=Eumeta variegata TaxID=151549 RepID=A0A4C1WEF8_EUMVA|nr:hypothetical protein EVAR_81395_1 [Eumeta japonica]
MQMSVGGDAPPRELLRNYFHLDTPSSGALDMFATDPLPLTSLVASCRLSMVRDDARLLSQLRDPSILHNPLSTPHSRWDPSARAPLTAAVTTSIFVIHKDYLPR